MDGLTTENRPYIRLAAAALTQGIFDYCCVLRDGWTPLRRDEIDCDATMRWFKSDDQSPRSFVWLCEILGYDPKFVRSKVSANPAEVLSKRKMKGPSDSSLEHLRNAKLARK